MYRLLYFTYINLYFTIIFHRWGDIFSLVCSGVTSIQIGVCVGGGGGGQKLDDCTTCRFAL